MVFYHSFIVVCILDFFRLLFFMIFPNAYKSTIFPLAMSSPSNLGCQSTSYVFVKFSLSQLIPSFSHSMCYCMQHAYNPDEDYAEVESRLRAHLESFLETAKSFNTIYTKVGAALSFYTLPSDNLMSLFFFSFPVCCTTF